MTSRKPNFRTGSIILNLALGLGALTMLAWAGASAVYRPVTRASATIPRSPDPLSNRELAVALTRLRLAAEPLAAAGCTAPEVTALVGRVRTHLQENIQSLRDADRDWGTTHGDVDRLERLVRGGQSEQVQALTAARAAYATADTQRRAVLQGIFDTAVDGLAQEKIQTLDSIKLNALTWDMPTQYLTATLSEADHVHLRSALANQRIALAHEETPDPTLQQYLATVNAMPAVSSATNNLQSLQEIRAAWDAAVGL